MKKVPFVMVLIACIFMISFQGAADEEEYMTDSGEIRSPVFGDVMTDSGELEEIDDDGSYLTDSGEIREIDEE